LVLADETQYIGRFLYSIPILTNKPSPAKKHVISPDNNQYFLNSSKIPRIGRDTNKKLKFSWQTWEMI
jgi:hypothetical protein